MKNIYYKLIKQLKTPDTLISNYCNITT
jgi:hypothetical protein